MASKRLPTKRQLFARLTKELRKIHSGECKTDRYSRSVCEGIYCDRVDSNLELTEALRAIYALAGQNKEVKKIIEEAIQEYGI